MAAVRRRTRTLATVAVCLAVSQAGTACAGDATDSGDPRGGERSGFDQPTVAPGTSGAGAAGSGATLPGVTAAPPGIGPMAPDAAVGAAVAAFVAALDRPDAPVVELIVQVPEEGAPYGFLTAVDPAVPGAVVERMWRNGAVGAPEPATSSPSTDVGAASFSLTELNWPQVIAALTGAPDAVAAKVGPLTGSRGITHVIVTRDLPFSDRVVARVYVDGGRSGLGGYVQYLPDGSVDKVQA